LRRSSKEGWTIVRAYRAARLLALALLASGCGADSERWTSASQVAGVELVPASAAVLRQCQRAANELGYAVPCPGVLPRGSYSTPPVIPGCRLYLVGTGCFEWRRWLIGSIEFPSKVRVSHLVIQGSPLPRSPERFVHGPAWWPGAKVEIVGRQRLRGRAAQWIEVPEGSGSTLGGHLVLMWTENGHNYGIGFHGHDRGARALDLAVTRRLTMVAPS
jgi:hypothetical protein